MYGHSVNATPFTAVLDHALTQAREQGGVHLVEATTRANTRPVRLRTDAELDVILDEIAPGRATFSCQVRGDSLNGALTNGGVCTTLLDLALSAAVQSTLGPSRAYRILEFSMSSCRPHESLRGRVEAAACVTSSGPRVVSASAQVRDQSGSTRALGTLTALVRSLSAATDCEESATGVWG